MMLKGCAKQSRRGHDFQQIKEINLAALTLFVELFERNVAGAVGCSPSAKGKATVYH
jgi:hypothetical protein